MTVEVDASLVTAACCTGAAHSAASAVTMTATGTARAVAAAVAAGAEAATATATGAVMMVLAAAAAAAAVTVMHSSTQLNQKPQQSSILPLVSRHNTPAAAEAAAVGLLRWDCRLLLWTQLRLSLCSCCSLSAAHGCCACPPAAAGLMRVPSSSSSATITLIGQLSLAQGRHINDTVTQSCLLTPRCRPCESRHVDLRRVCMTVSGALCVCKQCTATLLLLLPSCARRLWR